MSFDLVEDIAVLIETALPTITVKSELDAEIDNCIAINISGGYSPVHTFGGGGSNQKPAFVQPSFQITCRHLSESTLRTWWDAIKAALDGKTNYTPTGTSRTYMVIEQFGDINSLGRDDNRRHLESLNFDTQIINAY